MAMARRMILLMCVFAGLLGAAPLWAQTAADCDFDGDGTVGFGDFLAFREAYGSTQAACDLDGDGTVGFADFVVLIDFYGLNMG